MESKKKRVTKATKSKTITAKLITKRDEVRLMNDGSAIFIALKKGVQHGEEGAPDLPFKQAFIALPENGTIKEVKVEVKKASVIEDDVILTAIQADEPLLEGLEIEKIVPNVNEYMKVKSWPKHNIELVKKNVTEVGTIAEVLVCPFIYSSNRLELIESLDIQITYAYTTKESYGIKSVIEGKYLKKKYADLSKRVINAKELLELDADIFDRGFDYTLYPEVDYVIITSAQLESSFSKLARWRNMLGLKSRVVTIESIINGTVPQTGSEIFFKSNGYSDGGTRDEAEAIRNFVKWAVRHWCIDYVLIGGDTEIIPMRQGLCNKVGSMVYRNIADSVTSKRNELGHSANASSEKSTHTAGHAIDEDVTTYWQPELNDASPILTVGISNKAAVNRIDLQWGATYCNNYSIETSVDGSTWTNVFTQVSGSGGNETITPTSSIASFVRLVIPQQGDYKLKSIKIYGPSKGYYGGSSYAMSNTITHMYMSHVPNRNINQSLDEDLIIIGDGPHVGEFVPYNESANATTLGWYYIDDLYDTSSAASSVKTKYIRIIGPAAYHGNKFLLKSGGLNYIPTDLYYSDVSYADYTETNLHDWDYNNNGIYGEDDDQINSIPDVMIGRASIETILEADNFVDKVIYYERYMFKDEFDIPVQMSSDFAVSLLFGSHNFFEDVENSLDGSALGRESILKMFLAEDPNRFITTRLYQDEDDVPQADRGADLDAITKDKLLDAIENHNNVISLAGHGGPGGFCGINRSDVDDIVNYPGIWFGCSCLTNKIDYANGECFGETTMLNTVGGAVAYAGNTRFGWTGDAYIEKVFWEEMFTSSILGAMYREANIISDKWEKYSLNLLGDPGMRVWTNRPISIQVTHKSRILTGSQDYTVQVLNGSTGVEGVTVCCTTNEGMLVKGITDSNGEVMLRINPSAAGTMKVCTSGANTIPYIGSVVVEKAPERTCKIKLDCSKLLACKTNILCKTRIMCGPNIACGLNITCGPNILCAKLIHCGNTIMCKNQIGCGMKIVCGTKISCNSRINCTRLINCGVRISCNKLLGCGTKIACDRRISCKNLLSCGLRLSCKNLLEPRCTVQMIYDDFFDRDEWVKDGDYLDRIKELEKQEDIYSIVKERLVDTAKVKELEIENAIKSLPRETRKTFKWMLDKINEEE